MSAKPSAEEFQLASEAVESLLTDLEAIQFLTEHDWEKRTENGKSAATCVREHVESGYAKAVRALPVILATSDDLAPDDPSKICDEGGLCAPNAHRWVLAFFVDRFYWVLQVKLTSTDSDRWLFGHAPFDYDLIESEWPAVKHHIKTVRSCRQDVLRARIENERHRVIAALNRGDR